MFDDADDRTASLMTPTRLAQLKARPQPAPSPAAWLDQLAHSAGSGHVRRLQDLRHQLAALLGAGDVRPVLGACQSLQEALGQLDAGLAHSRGWLARLTGGGREDHERFAAQHARVVRTGEAFAAVLRDLHKDQQAQRTAVDRLLLECEGELRALQKILEQGARWLQDMRTQLKARPDEQDEARCELLVARLKLLRGTVDAVQHLLQEGRDACAARHALAGRWQLLLDGAWTTWRAQAACLLVDTDQRDDVAVTIEAARKLQTQLQAALLSTAGEARTVQARDQALHGELATLQASLHAAA